MTLRPTVPRPSERAASCASARCASEKPNEALVASVPPIDWNTRSTGAPASMHSIVLVTWVSTQDWVGIAYCSMISASRWLSRVACATLSVAGLMPITASPLP